MKRFLSFMRCYLHFRTVTGRKERLLWDTVEERYWILNSKDELYKNPNLEIIL